MQSQDHRVKEDENNAVTAVQALICCSRASQDHSLLGEVHGVSSIPSKGNTGGPLSPHRDLSHRRCQWMTSWLAVSVWCFH